MASINNKNGVMVYTLGGAMLISLVTEVVTANHYWKTLTGIALVAVLGIGFVAWTQLWTTAWAVMETQDKRVQRVAYWASFAVTLAMIVNAAFILATRSQENQDDRKARQEKLQIEELKSLDPAVARELLKQKGAESARDADERRREKSINDTGRKTETSIGDIAAAYIAFWVFIVPFGIAALAKFVVLSMIALPGGASGYLPSKQPVSSSNLEPAKTPNPFPSSIPITRSGPKPSIGNRIPIGRDGVGGPKN